MRARSIILIAVTWLLTTHALAADTRRILTNHIAFEGLEGIRIDARGGWYDATRDHGKHLSRLSFSTYFNPQQLPLAAWSLLTARELLVARADRNFRQIERRLLDEAMVGADYLVRVHRPGGSFCRSVSAPGFEKAPEDRLIVPAMTGFRIKRTQTDTGDHDWRWGEQWLPHAAWYLAAVAAR